MSVVLLPAPPALRPAALTIAAGLAVVEALTDLGLAPFGHTRPRLKWPNDVLVDGAKICGILTESRGFNPSRPHFVVGIGLNVRQLHFPPELTAQRPVTSLAILDIDARIDSAQEAVLNRLNPRLAQVRRNHGVLASDFLEASGLRDQVVEVHSGSEWLRGKVVGLSLGDGLELELTSGGTTRLPVEFIQSVERVAERD